MPADHPTEIAPARFAWRLTPDLDAVPQARRAFQDWLAELGADPGDGADMAVVLSELATNAVAGADGGEAEVSATLERDQLEVEVVNPVTEATGTIRRWQLDDPLRGGGRGLMIVRAYTDTLEIISDGATVTVRCTTHLDRR